MRSNIKWDLLKLRQKKMDKVGEWTDTGGLNITNPHAFHEFGMMNITLKVRRVDLCNKNTDLPFTLSFKR